MREFFSGLVLSPVVSVVLCVLALAYSFGLRLAFELGPTWDGWGAAVFTVLPGYVLMGQVDRPLSRGILLGFTLSWLSQVAPRLPCLGLGILSWCGNGRQEAWFEIAWSGLILGALGNRLAGWLRGLAPGHR